MKRKGGFHFRKIWLGVLAVAAALILAACDDMPAAPDPGVEGGPSVAGAEVSAELPGELVRVLYETSAGSMEYRSEFLAEVTPEELVRAEYWPENDFSLPYMSEKGPEPIRPEQWADIARSLTEIYSVLEEAPQDFDDSAPLVDENGEEMFALDGGDYWRLFLTWRTGDGEERTVRYFSPSDRRITTFDALMRELVDPTGREIVWYEAPVLNGIFVHSEEGDYSFQFTYFASEDNYYFISRYPDGGKKVDVSRHVALTEWDEAGRWFSALELERFPSGWSFHDPLTATLYYSDNTQTTVQPDADTAGKIYEYFVGLTEKYR